MPVVKSIRDKYGLLLVRYAITYLEGLVINRIDAAINTGLDGGKNKN